MRRMTAPTAAEILSGLDAALILAGIRRWVEIETPTDDPLALNRLMDLVAAECAALGGAVERLPGTNGRGDHLRVRFWPGDAPGVLVTSHLDTVWAHGTLAARPFRIEGDRAYGPGALDMKGGAYLGLHAVAEIRRRGWRPNLPVTLLFTSDEEVGSATSRALIEDTARASRYVLVPEPGKLPGGSVVTARKGWGRFDLTVHGRAAHAGAWHEEGRSAVAELARHVLALEALTDYATGLTVNVGVVRGGTRGNVVPAQAYAEIDVRAPDAASATAITERLLGLRPIGPDLRLEVTGGINRPPFERTPAVAGLYGRARALAAELGFELPEVSSGGVSDGNFTAALGVATLDGVGVVGHGPHAIDEHLLVPSLVPRAALMIGLLLRLD